MVERCVRAEAKFESIQDMFVGSRYVSIILWVVSIVVRKCINHYGDVLMGEIPSQITSLTIVYSTVYSDADQRKHQSSASLAFVCGIHRDRWIPRTKGQLRGKCFHLMTSSWWSLKSHFCCLKWKVAHTYLKFGNGYEISSHTLLVMW